MKLTGLEPLFRSMQTQQITRYKFRYEINYLKFDCLFFTDIRPFELVMGCRGQNFAIFLDVHPGFNIRPYIEPKDTYSALSKALRTHERSDGKLIPGEFFQAFNERIPTIANPYNTVGNEDVVRYYSDIEEADKIYFCGWLDNNQQGHRVTESNLYKTKLLLGQRAFDFSQRRNHSTRWTHEKSRAITLCIPD